MGTWWGQENDGDGSATEKGMGTQREFPSQNQQKTLRGQTPSRPPSCTSLPSSPGSIFWGISTRSQGKGTGCVPPPPPCWQQLHGTCWQRKRAGSQDGLTTLGEAKEQLRVLPRGCPSSFKLPGTSRITRKSKLLHAETPPFVSAASPGRAPAVPGVGRATWAAFFLPFLFVLVLGQLRAVPPGAGTPQNAADTIAEVQDVSDAGHVPSVSVLSLRSRQR